MAATNKIKSIREEYFGKDRERRYILQVYKICVEKLIVSNLITELLIANTNQHDHTNKVLCRACKTMFELRDSCFDSLYLHLRLLFAKGNKKLAHQFLSEVSNLTLNDYMEYFLESYSYALSAQNKGKLGKLSQQSKDALATIEKLYKESIGPYQMNAFHQADDGVHYDVKHEVGDWFGLPSNIYTRSSRFSRNPKPVREMLGVLVTVLHDFMRMTGIHYYLDEVKVEPIARDSIGLFNIRIDEATISKSIAEMDSSLKDHLHILDCGDGLSLHNQLQFLMIQKSRAAKPKKP